MKPDINLNMFYTLYTNLNIFCILHIFAAKKFSYIS